MKIHFLYKCLLLVGTAIGHCVAAPLRQTLDLAIPQLPTPIMVEGRPQYVYELHCTNFGTQDIAINFLEVIDADSSQTIASFGDNDLAARLAPLGFTGTPERVVPPGRRVVIYVEFVHDKPGPQRLFHRLGCRSPQDGITSIVTSPQFRPINSAPSVLGPPLKGGPWVAVHQPDWPRGHRRVFYAIQGRATLPGRFAIDWVKVNGSGRTSRGDPDDVKAALGYGAEVLAVADSTVADVRDGLPENTRISTNPPHTLDEGAGNFVSLRLADGRFAIYEHLQPGSIRVKAGEPIHRGDVIAALGFTGDSTGPHLHLHVGDTANPLAGEGIPYVFDEFTSLGRYTSIEDLGTKPWSPPSDLQSRQRRSEFPDSNVVVEFPE